MDSDLRAIASLTASVILRWLLLLWIAVAIVLAQLYAGPDFGVPGPIDGPPQNAIGWPFAAIDAGMFSPFMITDRILPVAVLIDLMVMLAIVVGSAMQLSSGGGRRLHQFHLADLFVLTTAGGIWFTLYSVPPSGGLRGDRLVPTPLANSPWFILLPLFIGIGLTCREVWHTFSSVQPQQDEQ